MKTVRVRIRGRIIRILDKRTIIINLGTEDGIVASSVFHILGEPEEVVDPDSKQVLGSVKVTKGRVRASQVFEKFTIATTSWTEPISTSFSGLFPQLAPRVIDEGELKVDVRELKPWKAISETPVKVGDEVEVVVEIDDEAHEEEDDEEDMDQNSHTSSPEF